MIKYITLLPFSTNQQDILLIEQDLITVILKEEEEDVEKQVVKMFKNLTGIKTKYKHWTMFSKVFNGDTSVNYYYKANDNFIYDYKNLVLNLRIANVEEVDNDLFVQLALSNYDMADLFRF